jgi:hypothetical protein
MPLEDWAKVAVWIQRESVKGGCFGEYLRSAMSKQIYNTARRTMPDGTAYGFYFWTGFADAPYSAWALGYGGQAIAWSQRNDRILLAFSTFENWWPEARRLFRMWAAIE